MNHISLRFAGNGVAPNTTRCKELAAVISATEELISAMTDHSEEMEQMPLSLVGLEDKSLGLKFVVSVALAIVAWQDVAAIINTGKFEKLSPKARQSLGEIVSFVKKKGCSAYLEDSTHGVIASFDWNIALPVEQKFRGGSSLMGEVLRVGGDEPKVRLRLVSGQIISCETSQAVARELGHRLYDTVVCRGVATWDYTSGEVLKFRIESVRSFTKMPASMAFAELAAAMPGAALRLKSQDFQYLS